MSVRIGWDLRFGEFTLWDHYYFSDLLALLHHEGFHVRAVTSRKRMDDLDVLVVNYPEIPIPPRDRRELYERVDAGLHLICAGYYQNEDHVAEILNELTEPLGVRLRDDVVLDPFHNLDEDPYMVVTRRLGGTGSAQSLLWPCSCSLQTLADECRALVTAENGARRQTSGSNTETVQNGDIVLATETARGRGRVTVLGTCVFWDNRSLYREDNALWTLELLRGRLP